MSFGNYATCARYKVHSTRASSSTRAWFHVELTSSGALGRLTFQLFDTPGAHSGLSLPRKTHRCHDPQKHNQAPRSRLVIVASPKTQAEAGLSQGQFRKTPTINIDVTTTATGVA